MDFLSIRLKKGGNIDTWLAVNARTDKSKY